MAHYIDKSAVIAEIERIYNEVYKFLSSDIADNVQNFKDDLLMNLDTLEIKEVNLDKECRKYLTEHFNAYEDGILQSKRSGMPLDTFDVIHVAKHFFELGMSVSNPITASDRGIANEIIFALKALGEEKMISYDKEIEWLRNKVK